MEKNSYILIRFEDRDKLVSAFRLLKESKLNVLDILSPIPIEELENEMTERKSFIGIIGLIAGILGFAAVLFFQFWVSGKAYPLFYGGKPMDVWLSYVPVLFESVVLLASVVIIVTFLLEIRVFSKKIKLPMEYKFTNDGFAIVLDFNSISASNHQFLDTNFEIEKIEV